MNRTGKFLVGFDSVEKNSSELVEVFYKMKFVPLRVESLYYSREIEYIGKSYMFDEVKQGDMIPMYEVTVNNLNDGIISISVKKY